MERIGSAPANARSDAAQALNECLADLNSDRFEIRGRGAEKLQTLAKDKAVQPALALALERLLLAPDTSYEVRASCEPVLSRLPAPPADSIPQITPEEIDRLLGDVDAASYGQRVARDAPGVDCQRNPQWAATVAEKLKQRLKDPQLPSDVRRQLVDPRDGLGALVGERSGDVASRHGHRPECRSLAQYFDVDHRDTARTGMCRARALGPGRVRIVAPKLKAAVAKCLENAELPPEAIERLTRLSDLCQPAMVAEIWEDRIHSTLQYLLVDVPQFPDQAMRSTHFSSIDDTTAHCVSGNSLAPGDYPVGVAIPVTHPQADYRENRMFQLINLPNARQRMLYDLAKLKVEPSQRLHELTSAPRRGWRRKSVA